MRGFTRSGPLPSGAATVAEHHVAVGSLVVAGAKAPAEDVDEHALRWQVFVWDLWFLLWGLALALAIVRFRRRAR